MRRTIRTFVSLLVVAAAAVDLAATTARRLSNEELADTAGIIVIGRVTDVRAVWENPRTLVTVATVSVTERLKGDAGDTISVALPGGADANRRFPVAVTYAGAPQMREGEDVFLFLSQDGEISSGLTDPGHSERQVLDTSPDGRRAPVPRRVLPDAAAGALRGFDRGR